MSKIRMYWWNEQTNFGDALNPILIAKLSGRQVEWASIKEADLVAAGSLLQWVASSEQKIKRPLYVWGSGYMYDKEPAITSLKVKHCAVRGYKSVAYGKLGDVAVGDPGLLADLLIEKPIPKQHAVGIIPHLWHLNDPLLFELTTINPALHIIDVRNDPLCVIEQIAACEFVFASSLHGLIVADAFNIPNQWLYFERKLFGGNWKFQDYYSVFNKDITAIKLKGTDNVTSKILELTETYARPNLDVIKQKLLSSFPQSLMG